MVFSSDNATAPFVTKTDKAIVTIDGTTCIALNVQVQFARQVEVVPVVSDKRVLSVGIPQGTASIETLIIEGDSDITSLLNEDGCQPFEMSIDMEGGCDAGSKSIGCKGCIASAVSVTAQGGRGYVAQGVQITFTALNLG